MLENKMVMFNEPRRVYPDFEDWAIGKSEMQYDCDENLIRYIKENDEFRFVLEQALRVPHTYMMDKGAVNELLEEFESSDLMVKWCRNYIEHPLEMDAYREWLMRVPMHEDWKKEMEVGLYAS